MPEFFYQIKARQESEDRFSRWVWPPVFTGKVEADDKKEARQIIDAEYGQKFPMRVLAKDIDSATFLLKIREIKEGDDRTRELFEVKACKQCAAGYRIIDHYNNGHQNYVGRDFCSDDCKDEWKKEHDARLFNVDFGKKHPATIYRITNTITGMHYIGQTSQPFTLRWWQHFFNGTGTKFHAAIAESNITDWTFCILEIINPDNKREDQNMSCFMHEREQFWINKYNSIHGGYNTATAKSLPEPMSLFKGEDHAN